MYAKHELMIEDLLSAVDKLEARPHLADCIASIFKCGLPVSDMLNKKRLDKSMYGLPLDINTYPFGKPTDIIYPSYLAVCENKGKFRETLIKMGNHGTKFGGHVEEMVMLTDHWDSKIFKEHEETFEIIRKKYGVRISVILVTDYSANIVYR
jgi:hypothetical protein